MAIRIGHPFLLLLLICKLKQNRIGIRNIMSSYQKKYGSNGGGKMDFPVPQKRISKRALPVWRISGIISSLIVIGILATILFIIHFFLNLSEWWYVLGVIVAVLYFILKVVVIPNIRWKIWRYEVREKEVELQHGVFVISRTLIPMVRVQHVDTVQGPLLRRYRLASLLISTAATVHHIPAIDIDEADQLRHSISSLAKVDEEDV